MFETLNDKLNALERNVALMIKGYEAYIQLVVSVLLADGAMWLVAVPGTGKTTLARTLFDSISDSKMRRIQFKPDMMPADFAGVRVFNPQTCNFENDFGLMSGQNGILADEINRTPPKTGAAMLEAMEERQITVGDESRSLPALFFVLATANPIENEGTYPMPEAQLDRFMASAVFPYASAESEEDMLRDPQIHWRGADRKKVVAVISVAEILEARELVHQVERNVPEGVRNYIIRLVRATRPMDESFETTHAQDAPELREAIACGASPRAQIALQQLASAVAFRKGRDRVEFEDVRAVAPFVLRHRIFLSELAKVRGVTTDNIVEKLLERVPLIIARAASSRTLPWYLGIFCPSWWRQRA